MKKTAFTIFMILFCALLLFDSVTAQTKTPSEEVKLKALQAEADKVARRYWATRITNCGTYSATTRSFGSAMVEQQIFLKDSSKQRKRVYIQIRYQAPTGWRAVSVSGMSLGLVDGTWRGRSTLGMFSQFRISYDNINWGSWTEKYPSFENELSVVIQKKNGKWYFIQGPKIYSRSKCS
jgi:hypothetical protein